jgi:hypothetical protein
LAPTDQQEIDCYLRGILAPVRWVAIIALLLAGYLDEDDPFFAWIERTVELEHIGRVGAVEARHAAPAETAGTGGGGPHPKWSDRETTHEG